ncbi:ribonuclease HI [Cobetia crustatorum]|uniref:Ribonuclease H n=1 Tax=Cobetia crustatorum TaxID=553385 RepID=A0A558HLP4_9GAMM|nr:ribonuclease HI [Cobetia crustatorum]
MSWQRVRFFHPLRVFPVSQSPSTPDSAADATADTLPSRVVIHTDGACRGNPGPGGWGAILVSGKHRKELKGSERETTNNRMEMTAAIEALKALTKRCDVVLWTDSEYVKNGITKWVHGWIKRGWKTAAKQPVKNEELWKALLAQSERHAIEWRWVKGHSGDEGNERADSLANEAIDEMQRRV